MRFFLFVLVLWTASSACFPVSMTAIVDVTARRTDDLPLAAAAGDVIAATSEFGSISFRVDAASPPGVRAEISASGVDQAEAEAVLARYRAVVEETPGRRAIRLVGEPVEKELPGGKRTLAATASFVVTVPPGTRLEAKSGSGSLSFRGPAASCTGETSFGSASAEGATGPVSLKTGSGSISVVACRGGDLDLASEFGSVTVRASEGAARIKAGSGSVTADEFKGELTARAEFGSVTASGVFSRVDLGSGSGAVGLTAGAGSTAAAAWRASSDFGSVRALVPRDFAAAVEAETSFGSLKLDHPGLRGESSGEKRRFRGELGRGGPVLTLKSGGGSVTLGTSER